MKREQMSYVVLLMLSATLWLGAACDDDASSEGGATTDTSGATTDTSGATTDTSGATTDTSGATTDTSGATTDTSGATTDDTNADDADTTPPPPTLPSYCVGIRGNGELIFAHFASLARIIEYYGLPQGVAGGSSASITAFLLESVSMNPAVRACGGAPCDPVRAGERAAFLFKSLPAYAAFLGSTDEGQAFTQLAPVIQQAIADGIGDLLDTDIDAARQALIDLFNSPDIIDLINPEALSLLTSSPDPAFHAQEMYDALTSFGSFSAADDKILIRPGIIHFAGLAEKVGRIGSFYAGYGGADAAAWEALMVACADGTQGMPWPEIAARTIGDVSCQDAFLGEVAAWRADWIANEDTYTSRIDDEVGAALPALISTSVLTGATKESWAAARANYIDALPYVFTPDFGDVSFGYWGQADDLAKVQANAQGYDDAKTARFRSLGVTTWRSALSMSPAEPGLSRAIEIDADQVSAGGWSDLQPVLVLKNMGCDQVVYLTRRGGESGFAQGVAALLGIDPDTATALYDLTEPTSGFSQSLGAADGVWCTDWNTFSGTQVQEISADGYGAPFVTDADAFTTAAPTACPNATPAASFPGCTPGVSP
jgi:hypothetical protein